MNNKGFSLVELLGSLIVLALILGIGLYSARGTLATATSTLTDVNTNEIYDASKLYVMENPTNWINNGEEYTCLTIFELVDAGYFESGEVLSYKDSKIKIVRNPYTKVINSVKLVDVCE